MVAEAETAERPADEAESVTLHVPVLLAVVQVCALRLPGPPVRLNVMTVPSGALVDPAPRLMLADPVRVTGWPTAPVVLLAVSARLASTVVRLAVAVRCSVAPATGT